MIKTDKMLSTSVGNGFTCYLTQADIDGDEGIRYTTHGILVTDKFGEKLLEYKDISTNRSFVEKFIEMCTFNDVSFIHIPDLLEDYLF